MHHIDLIGSFIVGGLLLVALLGLVVYFNLNAHSTNFTQIEQQNLTEFGRVVEYDFNKMGYRVTAGDTIVAVDSTFIRFRADLNNDGAADSVCYVRSGVRPNFRLTRHTTLAPRGDFALPVGDFSLRFFDQNGAATANPKAVRAIEFRLLLQKDLQLQNQVDRIGAYWTRKFYPKNL